MGDRRESIQSSGTLYNVNAASKKKVNSGALNSSTMVQMGPTGEQTSSVGHETTAFVSIQKRASNSSPLNDDLQILLKDK